MKITFVYPDLLEFIPDYPGHYYEGVGSLSSYLRARGFQTSLVHIIQTPLDRKGLLSRLEEHRPDLIAFSCTTLQFSVAEKVSKWIKEEWPEIPIICGGVHPTLMPEQTLACPGIDMLCVGEGEQALATLCERLTESKDIRDIPNLWIKQNGKIFRNPPAPPERDINTFPFSDRTIFDYPNLWWERLGTATLMASRGCPFNCNYCCNKALRKVYPKNTMSARIRNVENVLEEILQIREEYPFVNSLNFDDDILFLDKRWARRFAEEYSRKVGLPFYCNIRPNLVDEETVALMKKANCREVRIGLESGNDRIRNSILNRNLPRDQIINACKLFIDAGIYVRTFNMIGIPEETPKEILDTIKMNAEIGIDFPQYTVFYPFPGTQLSTLCKEKGLTPCRDMIDYFSDSPLDLPTLSREQLQMFLTHFLRILQIYRLLFRLHPFLRTPLMALLNTFFSFNSAPWIVRNLYKTLRFTRLLSLFPKATRNRFIEKRKKQQTN